MVLVLSSNSNLSSQVKREVERAINKDVIVIPFRIEDVSLSKSLEYHLSVTHWMDAFSPPIENHLQTLSGKIRLLLHADSGVEERPLQPARRVPVPTARPSSYNRPAVYLIIGLAVGLIALASLFLWWSRSKATPEAGTTEPAVTTPSEPTVTPAPTPKSEPSRVQEKAEDNQNKSANSNAEADTGDQPRVPVIIGKSYDVARKILINAGWQPNKNRPTYESNPNVQSGNGPIFWKRGYWEVESCAGSSLAECRFHYIDPSQRVLIVTTEGEEDENGKYHALVRQVVFDKK
jgi:hypothetical protein